MTNPFMELYAEGDPASFRDAIVDALLAAGAERQSKPQGRSRTEFVMQTSRRGVFASLLFEGEMVFELSGALDALIAYSGATGRLAGALSGQDEWSSVHTYWSEYQAGRPVFSGSNQDLNYDLSPAWQERLKPTDGQEIHAAQILPHLDAQYGPRQSFGEEWYFGPKITSFTSPLEERLREAIAVGADVEVPGFARVRHVNGNLVIRPLPVFGKTVSGEVAATSPEIQALVMRLRTLKPLERLAIGEHLLIAAQTMGGYQGRNPRTGEVIEVPPRTLAFFETCASTPAVQD